MHNKHKKLINSIKIISFNKNGNYDKELYNLPKSLEKLYLPVKYNKKIVNLSPSCVIIIVIQQNFCTKFF